MKKTKTIKVDYLARVEGETAMFVDIDGDKVVDVRLNIFEPPRFFEALLVGRDFTEAPDITCRICGICPVTYLMSSSHAMESICNVTVNPTIRALRRLLYCGEWIKSHGIHVFMLHLPDFLGFSDVIQMAEKHGDFVTKGLGLKKTGNTLMKILSGRVLHPVNIKVGGFYKLPEKDTLRELLPELKQGIEDAHDIIKFLNKLDYPDFEQDYEYYSLVHPDEYPFNEGDIHSSGGLKFPIAEFDKHFTEEQVEHSTALHTYIKGRAPCLVGPPARFYLNHDKLTPEAKKVAEKINILKDINNPFKSILVRTIEIMFCLEEAIKIIENYEPNSVEPFVEVKPKAGVGFGCTEAPRGFCHHRYEIDAAGKIVSANIVPPTTINQKRIEEDLYNIVTKNIYIADEELKFLSERTIRNYDPCISCSAHFLTLHVNRR